MIKRPHRTKGALFAPASLFLVLSLFACLGVTSVWSNPVDNEDNYAGWFSKRQSTSAGESNSASTLPPPPGVGSSPNELRKCVFEDVIAIDEESSSVLLNKTLVVDGCLLDCDNKVLKSTVDEGSIVAVRNGGHVKNCAVVMIKPSELKEELARIDLLDNIFVDDGSNLGTDPPTLWGTYAPSGGATWIQRVSNYISNDVSGFLCDQGDCVLENSSCNVLEFDADDPPINFLVMQRCLKVQLGATDVRVQGGLVTSDIRAVSVNGIVVDADSDPERTQDENISTKARLFVDNVTIRNQLSNGIIIIGGANTIRISDSTLSDNTYHGIYLLGGYGLESFAVLGGSIENNSMCGMNIAEYEEAPNTNQFENLLPPKMEMIISGVLLKNNEEDGIRVIRIDDIVIDGAIIQGNNLNGIDIWDASTVSLQGVICKNNVQNGLSIEAENSTVTIDNSVFWQNGKRKHKSPYWRKAGVYMWRPKQVTITNSVSNSNLMDGILIYDVPKLKLTDVDLMGNGNDGIEIRESRAAYGYDYTGNSNYLVGAYYYPWHGDDFHNGGGYLRKDLEPPQTPELGEYDDSDPDVITQHLDWFRKSNIGLLVASWWGPDRLEDSNILDVIMEHDYVGNLQIALHYETTNRIIKDGDMSVVESDIEYMCENYFGHKNYYKIDGRPVLVVYISRKLEELGSLESSLLTMRSVASKCDQNIYLIGDAVFAKAPDADEPFVSFRYFDAVTNYDVYGSSGASKRDSSYAGTEAVDEYYAEQERWRELALKQDCRYIPPVSPGYNDRSVRPEKDNLPLSRRLTESSEEGSLFKYQLDKALPLVDPEVDNLILVNSFNEWHEDTQIEPVLVNGDIVLQKELGNVATKPEKLTNGLDYVEYGDLYLDILRSATSKAEEDIVAVQYEPTIVDFRNVRTCKNRFDGMRFYVRENSYDDQTEFVFNSGSGVISCGNERNDYELYGGGNVQFKVKSLVGDTCANGKQAPGCEFSQLLKSCKKADCSHRDIVTTSGDVINIHKIE